MSRAESTFSKYSSRDPRRRRRRDAKQGNPARGVPRNPETGRERFFSVDELAKIAAALDAYSFAPAADCLRLILSTGCRPGEAMHARWEEFSEPGTWTKPGAATKQRKTHRAMLSPDAAKLVAQLWSRRERGAEYLFPLGGDEPRAQGGRQGVGLRQGGSRAGERGEALRSEAQLRQPRRRRWRQRLGLEQAARALEQPDDREIRAQLRRHDARSRGGDRQRHRRRQRYPDQARPRQCTLSAGASRAPRSRR